MEATTELFGAGPEEGRGVRITEADIPADNGVVHLIDDVRVPAAVVTEMRP